MRIVGRLCQTPTGKAFHRNALQFIVLDEFGGSWDHGRLRVEGLSGESEQMRYVLDEITASG
jgi:hypothetical protein